MSFEYIINQDEKIKKLTQEEKEQLVSKISSKFVTLNSERSENLEMASNLANEIFFKNDFKSLTDKNQKWKAKIKMCETFMFYQTLKAFIWRNTYANVNSMFDVSGENHDSNNASNKQKAMLVDILEKMGYQKTCDQIIDNALLYGELIFHAAVIDGDSKAAKELYEAHKKELNSASGFISIQRILYAYYTLVEPDVKKANTFERGFENSVKNYPFPKDAAIEKEQFDLVAEVLQKKESGGIQ